MILRDYQQRAYDAVINSWREHQCVLIVCATGTGKTVTAAHLIRERMKYGRVMVVAHREELLRQASATIQKVCGITPDMEMAEFWADQQYDSQSPVIVASVQTLNSGMNGDGRMIRFRPEEFSMLWHDESHHAVSDTNRKTIEHFAANPNCKVLGVTATPDRTDEKALGQIFTDCAYDYDVSEAVKDGWLVPIQANQIMVRDLDFSQIRTTAGELNGADLDAVMNDEDILHRIAGPTMEISDGRRTLVFSTSCRNAERLCEIFNRHRHDCARYVDGKTDKDIRRDMLDDYRRGEFQLLVNVGVATEGFDIPGIEVVVPRPTKSRSLMAQMIGRATRPEEGLVDQYETSDRRRQAIAESGKPYMEILDFCGVTGRHKLMHAADILGGKFDDDIVERANRLIGEEDGSVDVESALQRATREAEQEAIREAERKRRQLSQRSRQHVKARVKYSLSRVDLFNALEMQPMRLQGWDVGKTLSEKQSDLLKRQGVDPNSLNYAEAKMAIGRLMNTWKNNLCTPKMIRVLQRAGWYDEGLDKTEGSRRITALKQNSWRRPSEPARPEQAEGVTA